ncbi:MAG: phospho-sugar mutase [Bradymonadia bacterium]
MTEIVELARRWVEQDPDPETKAAGALLIESGSGEVLASHFGHRLSFGTAGMRGALGPGPNRMNASMVIRVTSAVGQYVKQRVDGACERGAVIGYDGRHGSRPFADYAARVLLAEGFKVYRFDSVVPTPRLAHALHALGGAVGIMVTASHNPPQDNGYKVYWEDGAQIIPPHDQGISAILDTIDNTMDIPLDDLAQGKLDGRLLSIPDSVQNDYFESVQKLRVYSGPTPLKLVYSAMHGVGRASVERVLAEGGYANVHSVEAQAEPDPDFPTVSFPNPEEDGAMDLSLELASAIGADLILANDPDADRLCVGIPHKGGYRLLTGNEIGVLLADELLHYGHSAGDALVVTTIVSTSMLQKIAAAYGAKCAETLTGFKWLAHEGMKHQASGGHFAVGFEEAIGYSIGGLVRDKDGVSAALIFADLASRAASAGLTVEDRLNQLYRRHGLYLTTQKSFVFPGQAGKETMDRMMESLRDSTPQTLDGSAIHMVKDYGTGQSREVDTAVVGHIDLPKSNVLGFHMENGSRLMVRPSGTEPKIKFYFEICESVQDAESVDETSVRASKRLASFVQSTMAMFEQE